MAGGGNKRNQTSAWRMVCVKDFLLSSAMGWKHESERDEREKTLLKINKGNGVFNQLFIFFHVICKCTK